MGGRERGKKGIGRKRREGMDRRYEERKRKTRYK